MVSKVYGTRKEVKAGVARMTTGGLKKRDIIKRRVVAGDGSVHHKYVSRAKREAALQNPEFRAYTMRVKAMARKGMTFNQIKRGLKSPPPRRARSKSRSRSRSKSRTRR